MKANVLNATWLLKKALLSALTVTVAVALPWLCHLLGGHLGLGSGLGEMLLPMHLPVMLAGMLWGPEVGLICGVASPLVSFALTNMPGPAMVPFMVVELAVYGLSAGLLTRSPLPVFPRVLLTQLAGRAVRALVLVVAIYGFGFTALPLSIVWTSISAGVVGILLQWALIPLLLREADR